MQETVFRSYLCFMATCLLTLSSGMTAENDEYSIQRSALQDDLPDISIWKGALEEAYQRHFNELEAEEERVLSQIKALQMQRQDISARKRSHVHCLVNLIACYRKRK
ncbi:hypothetical protein CHS0354_016240 [Potamilus streckersoni]|uniref:Uncharacterized protein n=1 Tax=Potamilus streckersoni TaxID=2493646 RepID=A0AAE0RXL8_9BIVA|nr:hypothetical protein CHS0354_016240 [Potamilus streckersoni]